MAEQPSTLVITELGTVRVATVDGDIDMALADHFERALVKALGAADLIVDLGACTFLDSSGLRALVSSAREADRQGRRMVLARPSTEVAKLLELTGIGTAIATYEELGSAERALSDPPHSSGD